jgi:hypothetical protein
MQDLVDAVMYIAANANSRKDVTAVNWLLDSPLGSWLVTTLYAK